MNITELTNTDYTRPLNLYELSVVVSGKSESRIAPFRGNRVSVEFRDTTTIVSNVRGLQLTVWGNDGMAIMVTADVAIYASSYSEAIRIITKETFFVDVIGLGGILTLTEPMISLSAT